MNTGWNSVLVLLPATVIINLLGNEYWLELPVCTQAANNHYKPTGK